MPNRSAEKLSLGTGRERLLDMAGVIIEEYQCCHRGYLWERAYVSGTQYLSCAGVQYNAADQMTAMAYFGTWETRAYNSMNQVTNVGSVGETYVYPSGRTTGRSRR